LISTNAFDALHDIQDGGLQFAKLNPESQVSAFFIGLKERSSVFSVRRQIDALPDANLMAVMPGVALDDLWSTMDVAENALLLMALGVLITTILGITATLLVSLQSRRRELAIFRALGVKPYQLLSLILIEAFLVCLSGIILGWFVLQGLIYTSADYLRREWGVVSEPGLPTPDDLLSLLYLVIIVLLFAGIPAIKAYRMALNDGLNPPS
jgi:putative ABC transport system permease protein